MNILDLTGRTALVTGGGQGIGRQTALHLAAYGARVVVNDYFLDRAEAVAHEIATEHGADRAIGVQGDVTDYASLQDMQRRTARAMGAVDILVNNAGNAGPGQVTLDTKPFWEQDPSEWQRWMKVNLDGVMLVTRTFLPEMVTARRGSIISVISDAGRVGEPDLEPYSAAKAGVGGFTRAIARKIGRHGLRANCVSISTTRTPATDAEPEDSERAKKALQHYVIRRFGQPDDIANMILFLASDAASWITGQTYPVNGGYNMAT